MRCRSVCRCARRPPPRGALWSLQRAYAQAWRLTPVAHVQHLCLLEKGAPGDTVFAVARRWGFKSPDGAFRDGYWATYGERPSDTLKRARAPKEISPPAAADHVVRLECGKKMRRLRRHLGAAHGLTPRAYRQQWGLQPNYPLVCAELSRQVAARARVNDLAGKGARRSLVSACEPCGAAFSTSSASPLMSRFGGFGCGKRSGGFKCNRI
jgi:hypothetical protein